jgi:hypothetical protein
MPDNDDDIELLQQLIGHGGTQAFSLVPAAVKKVVAERQWQARRDRHGKPFASFEAFVTHPLWHGLETSIDDLRVYCRKFPDILAMILAEMQPGETHVEAGAKGGRGRKAADNVRGFYGNSALYTLKRLKRDRPDLFQQVLGGAMSANAAAIEAGFRQRPTPLQQIQTLWTKLNREERDAHLEWTLAHCATCGREGRWTMKDGSDGKQGSWCDECCYKGVSEACKEQ